VSKVGLMLLILMLAVTALVACSPKSDVDLMAAPGLKATPANVDIYKNQKLSNSISLKNEQSGMTMMVYYDVTSTTGDPTFTTKEDYVDVSVATDDSKVNIVLDSENMTAQSSQGGGDDLTRVYTLTIHVWFEAEDSTNPTKYAISDVDYDKVTNVKSYMTESIVNILYTDYTFLGDAPEYDWENDSGWNKEDSTGTTENTPPSYNPSV